MAYLQGVKEFNAAAAAPDQHPDIVAILARTTALNKPELVKAIAPHWSYINEDGMPPVDSIMEMQDYWSGKYFTSSRRKCRRSSCSICPSPRRQRATREGETVRTVSRPANRGPCPQGWQEAIAGPAALTQGLPWRGQ